MINAQSMDKWESADLVLKNIIKKHRFGPLVGPLERNFSFCFLKPDFVFSKTI